jgi:hypothetical protein
MGQGEMHGRALMIALSLATVGCYGGRGDFSNQDAIDTADGGDGDGDGGSGDAGDTDGDPNAAEDPGRVTLRRLNNTEYNNTIRDLFYGLDVAPADVFPADEVSFGFDNIADVQSVTPVLFELYERAAEQTIDAALADVVSADTMHAEAEELGGSVGQASGGVWALSSNGTITAPVDASADGDYVVRVRAYGQQAGPDLPNMTVEVDGLLAQSFDVAETSAAPGEFTVDVAMTAGPHQVTVAFTNDFYDAAVPADRNLYVDWIEVEGPTGGAAGSGVHDLILTCTPAPGGEADCAEEIVTEFGRRAYRRPLTTDEVTALVTVMTTAQDEGSDFEDAMKVTLKAILVSPHFLFRVEVDPDPASLVPHPLGDYELATRMSYLLWSTMPDDELFDLAAAGMLQDETVIAQQVARMLSDGRADALVDNFAGQWLFLRNLDNELSKDYDLFPEFDADLQVSMKTEAELFFRTFLEEDRDLRELLTADDTFVDARLAELYGLPAPAGAGFERVSLEGVPRRGLLTQGGMMSMLAHATTTSPVRRGKWVLDQLMCIPPPPPPPGVEVPPLEPSEGGTMREQLAQHRVDPACAGCHALMDPIGLGLENYDAIGRYRTIDAGVTIDASGELPGGVTFDDGLQLIDAIANGDEYSSCTVEHTMTYALGRAVESEDDPYIDEIITDWEAGGMSLRSLLVALVTNDTFRMRRGEAQ